MDLNQLLYNLQLAKLNARRAASMEDRKTYFDLVTHYEKRVSAYRREHGMSETSWLRDEGPRNARDE